MLDNYLINDDAADPNVDHSRHIHQFDALDD
ncbi:uncharacterized protein METZ01_LOCUS199524, partial [marine metagenome]